MRVASAEMNLNAVEETPGELRTVKRGKAWSNNTMGTDAYASSKARADKNVCRVRR